MCGEFNSGVQIIGESEEEEKVFKIKKFTNHPNYNPKRVWNPTVIYLYPQTAYIIVLYYFQNGVGEGGPYEGNDISVYHVETDFVMQYSTDEDSPSRNTWIWPVCLPKDDSDPNFETDRGMIAGWLDAPPIDQTYTKILGSAVSEADIFR